MINSPIQKISFNNFNFLIKRDDLLDKDFSGNKARKLYYFLKNDFSKINTLISHGSNQSNSMYSLSVLCKIKKWKFIYYTTHIPKYLEDNPNGNYKYSLENNMQIIYEDIDINTLKEEGILIVKEGGAISEASFGIKLLANEINEYIKINNLVDSKIFLPSGTGTTSLFLQKYCDVEVLTCSCVGDDKYLKKQFLQLESNENYHPTILKKEKKFHFGKLYKSNYEMYLELKKQTNIEFDLLYDPIGFQTLLYNKNSINLNNVIYIHQGGILGNQSMLPRYERKYNF